MAVDVSTLSIKVATSGIDDSTTKLDKLSTSADKAEVATKKFSTSSSSSYQAVTKELQNLQRVANTTSIVPASSGTAAAVAEIKMVTNAIAGVGTQSKKSADESKNAFQAIGGSIAQLRTLLGGGLIMGGLVGMSSAIIDMADSWKMMQARLEIFTKSAEVAKKTQNELADAALRLRAPLDGIVQLYTRALPALQRYNYTAKDAMTVTTSVAAALKLSGATGAEASSVMLQFSQALQAGRLNGAEFNAVAEGAPIILLALEKQLGKTRAELKAMGAAGTLDITKIVDTLKTVGPAWEAQVGKLPVTFDAAMTNLKTSFTRAIGEMEQKSGVVSGLAKGIMVIADNAKIVANIIGTTLVVAISYYITKTGLAVAATIASTIAKNAEIASNLRLAETEAIAAAAKLTSVRAQHMGLASAPAVVAATQGMATANSSLAAAQTAAAGGATILSRALMFLGGPIGIITMLLTAGALVWANWGDNAADVADKAAERIMRTKGKLEEFNAELNKADVASVQKGVALLDEKIKKQKEFLSGQTSLISSPSELFNTAIFRLGAQGQNKDEAYLNSLLVERSNLLGAIREGTKQSSEAAVDAANKEKKAIIERNKAAAQALFNKNDKQAQYQKKLDELDERKGKMAIGLDPSSAAYAKLADQYQRERADLEKLNPALIEEAKNRAASAKEARAQAAAQAKQAAATNQQTEANSAYSNALQSVKEFQDGLNQAETTHKSLLIDINNKTRQAVDDINQKTAAIEAERKGTILTASTKIAMDAREKQAAAEAIDLKIREQEILRENSSTTLLEARRNYDAQVTRIEQIGTATTAEAAQARAAAVNQLQFYAGEIKKQTAIEQTIGKLTAEAEAQEKISLALKLQAGAQAMLDMERVGRSLGQVLSDGFGEAAKSLGTLMTLFEDYSAQQKKIEQDKKVALEGGQNAAKVEQTYLTATAKLSAKAYADMAGASKRLLKEKTAGYKVLNAAEKAFRIYEMMMAAKSFAQKLALSDNEMVAIAAKNALTLAGIAAEKTAQMGLNIIRAIGAIITQGSAGPIIGFAAMAAMAAAVIALGVSVGGGGGQAPTSAAQLQEQAGTGTVFGDLTAKSESISKAMDNLVENSSLSADLNAGMLASLKNIEASMTGFTSVIIRSGIVGKLDVGGADKFKNVGGFFGGLSSSPFAAIDPGLAFAVELTDKLSSKSTAKTLKKLFGGKTTTEDYGITSGKQSLGSIASGGLMSQGYTNIKKSGGWFSKDKYSTTLAELPQEVSAQFSMVVNNMRDGVLQAGKVLGMGSGFAGQLDKFVVDIGNISLKGLSAEDIQKQFSTIFSKIGDDLAKFGFGEAFLAKYQKVGEGAFETLMRVASAIATVDGLFLNLGIDVSNAFDSISMSGVDAKMQLIEFAGGLDKLSSSLGAYYDKYYTDAEKQKIVADQVGAKLSSMGLNVLTGADEAATLANFRKLVEQQNLGTESGRRAYAALLEIAPTFADLAGKLGAGELLGVGQTIPQAQMDAANAWWEAKGGPAAVDTQQVIADGITTLNDLGAKDKTIAAMATQNAADTAATIQTLREMVAAQQTTNNILMAKIDSLTAAVADAGKKTVDAVVDTANTVTR